MPTTFSICNSVAPRLRSLTTRDARRPCSAKPERGARASRAEWSPECLAVEHKRRDALADDVADYLVKDFIVDEVVHQLCESLVAEGPWFANIMGPKPWPGLCRVRPLRPSVMGLESR